jgi:adenine-specific DNA-methyltransferase
LTWPNKDRRLLSHGEDTYTWVDPADWRVSEVRLFHHNRDVGEDPADNLLIHGDALHALTSLTSIPEHADQYVGKVQLVYIDPPFNTGQAFTHYDDALEHSVWLTMLRDRLVQIKRLLARDGSVWVHLDDTELHRARCVLDEVFGADNYLGTVIWQRTSAKSLARRTMGTMHESILVYGRSADAELKTIYLDLDPAYVAKRYTNSDERGRYDTGDLTATSYRPHLDSGKPWRGHNPSARRRCWAVPTGPLLEAELTPQQLDSMTMLEKLDALDDAGYIHWPDGDGFPRFKKYLHRARGRAVGDLWTDITVINSQAVERTGFSTQKPEALLERILTMGTEPGDVVLDCFAGSGTTAVVAHKMGRRWVTVEVSEENITSFVRPRLEKVIKGEEVGGITPRVEWEGGGGFRELTVAPSMFVNIDDVVVLADWVTNGELAQAVCAQLGYEYQAEQPFSGRKGNSRLAVIDGMLTSDVVDYLRAYLTDKERLLVVAQALEPGVEDYLRRHTSGSKARKVPRDLARVGRRPSQTIQLTSADVPAGRRASKGVNL